MTPSAADLAPEIIEVIQGLRLALFDFDGVFTSNHVFTFEDGREAVMGSRFDGIGLRRLERAGVIPFVLSAEKNPVVSTRCKKLSIECLQGCGDKNAAFDEILAQQGITAREVAFVGNDINDIPCLKRVGLPVVVADAYSDVLGHAVLRTSAAGGHGAVREICDLIASIREKQLFDDHLGKRNTG
jgi:YrbI family 3-deoxy-D-manno-octulosonate 8-phosphate phosphatase